MKFGLGRIKLTIRRKLMLGFGVVLVLMIVVVVMGAISLNRIRISTHELVEIQSVMEAIDRSAEYLLLARMKVSQYISSGQDSHLVDAESARRNQQAEWKVVRTYSAAKVPNMIRNIERVHTTYEGILDKVVITYQANPNDSEPIFAALNETDEFYTHLVGPADEQLRKWHEANVVAIRESVSSLIVTAVMVFALIGVVAIVVSVVAAYRIGRGITGATSHLSAAAESISRGDLDVPIEVKTGDELEALGDSIERMRASLEAAIERLRLRRAQG